MCAWKDVRTRMGVAGRFSRRSQASKPAASSAQLAANTVMWLIAEVRARQDVTQYL